jgi:hypothetical protein
MPCAQSIAINGRYIPNSPTTLVDAGITAQHPSGWFATLKARHFGESPLVEDNSATKLPRSLTTSCTRESLERSVPIFNLSCDRSTQGSTERSAGAPSGRSYGEVPRAGECPLRYHPSRPNQEDLDGRWDPGCSPEARVS